MKKSTLILFFIFSFINQTYSQINVDTVFIENKLNPIGITTPQPRLTWLLSSNKKNSKQTAYEVKVAQKITDLKNKEKLVWNSGKITSDQSVHISYNGKKLTSNTNYYCQVRVWDTKGKVSKWSPYFNWQTGLFNSEQEFSAKWITMDYEKDTINRPSPLFRKTFSLKNKKIKRATAFITSHGLYEAELNGKKIGDSYLTPGWTSYNTRLQYQVYNVTEQLNTSKNNAIGVSLGNGWHRDYLAWGNKKNHYGNDIALLFQLEVLYEDGSKETIISDKSWKWAYGAILSSEIYDGELYDSSKEIEGWSSASFNDSNWESTIEKNFTKKNLIATENETIKKQEEISPISIQKNASGKIIVDFGQNIVGMVQLKVSGKKGDKIDLYHAEVLQPDGNLYLENLRLAAQKNTYILNGNNNQILEPHFTFQGFRYVQVDGFPGELKAENITAIAMYSDMTATGDFTTSNKQINQLQQNIQWGQKGNFLDIPTDCPQRDERLGWTGDAQAFFRTAAYNMNVENFFAKWLKDVKADQLPNGSIPYVVPNVLGPNSAGSAGWGDVATIIPWEMYELYGDKEVLENQYESMKSWVSFISSKSDDNLWRTGFHFGDWLFYTPDDDRDGKAAITDKYLIAQCFYAYSTQLVLNAANVLNKSDDIAYYTELLKKIKTAFKKEYTTASGRLVSGTQTAYVLALHFDMLPENLRKQAADRLVQNIKSYGYHLTTGFLGTPYLNHVLSRFGHSETAYKLLLQDTYPSWLYPVTQGATTIWERWDGIKPDGTFQTPTMNSFNHYAYGAIGDWMYRNITGVNSNIEGPGYKKFTIKIIPGGELTSASATLKTHYGVIKSSWTIDNNLYKQQLSVPVNTSADVYIPSNALENIKEGNKAISKNKTIKVIAYDNEYIHLQLGSGSYSFSVDIPEKTTNKTLGYEGTYTTVNGFLDKAIISQQNGSLFLIIDGNKTELKKGTVKNEFISKTDNNIKLSFIENTSGKINSLLLDYKGVKMKGIKTDN